MQNARGVRFQGSLWKALAGAMGVVLVAVLASLVPGVAVARTTQTEGPVVEKSLKALDNGYYQLDVSVSADDAGITEGGEVDVVIIQDVSGSMEDDCYVEDAKGNLGKDGSSYMSLYYKDSDGDYNRCTYPDTHTKVYYRSYWFFGWHYNEYSGARYYGADEGRLGICQECINDLATKLLSHNTATNPNLVRVGLVAFSDGDIGDSKYDNETRVSLTNDLKSFKSAVNNLSADGGTNWDAGLLEGTSKQMNYRDSAQKIVIFVSDGNPTYYLDTKGAICGPGDSDTSDEKCYNHAKEVAKDIVGKGYDLYCISAFGNVTNMERLVTDAYGTFQSDKYYRVQDKAQLVKAFDEIVSDLASSFLSSYMDITVTDVLSQYAALDKVEFSFSKTVGGNLGTLDSTATYEPSTRTVTWNLNDIKNESASSYVTIDEVKHFVLQPNTVYTISMKIHPSTSAFDLVTDFVNNEKTYSSSAYPEFVYKDKAYSVKSNDSAGATYKKIQVEQKGEKPQTIVGPQKETTCKDYPTMPVNSNKLTVTANWVGDEDVKDQARPNKEIKAKVTRDDGKVVNVVLTAENKWSVTIDASFGVEGHTYTVTETTDGANTSGTVKNYTLSCEGQKFSNGAKGKEAKGELKFNETYSAQSAVADGIAITKAIDGRAWKASDAFEFTIAPKSGAPAPKDAQSGEDQTSITLTSADIAVGGTVAKGATGSITFTKPGTYTYEVAEVEQSGSDVITDTAKYTVTYTVGYNGKGALVAKSSYAKAASTAGSLTACAFTNKYSEIKLSDVGGVDVTTKLTGKALTSNLFTYKVYVANGDTASAAKFAGGTYKNDEAAAGQEAQLLYGGTGKGLTAALNDLVFTNADVGKTYTWYVKEQALDPANGYTQDTAEHKIQIGVAYKNNAYEVTITIDSASKTATVAKPLDEPMKLCIANSYEATGEIILADPEGGFDTKITKTLVGREMTAGEFKFNVYNQNDAAKTVVTTGVTANKAAVAENTPVSITFEKISYKLSDLEAMAAANPALATKTAEGKFEITYVIAEDTTNLPEGVQAADYVTLKVSVEDKGDGTLEATADYPEEGSLAMVNQFSPKEISLNVAGTLTLTSDPVGITPIPTSNEFTFALYKGNYTAASQLKAENLIETVKNNGGVIGFTDALNYDDAVAEDWYTVVQTTPITGEGAVEGYTKDNSLDKRFLRFKVTVAKSNEGVLSATVKVYASAEDQGREINLAQDPMYAFTNVYVVESTDDPITGTGEGKIAVNKVLDGRALQAGEFTFALTDSEGKAIVSADGTNPVTGTNDANGNVSLNAIKYTLPGEYTYKLSEVVPENALPGVTYDSKVYTVVATATVVDNKIAVSYKVTGEESATVATFTNTYASSGAYTLSGKAIMTGRDFKDGEFSYAVTNAADVRVTTAEPSGTEAGVRTLVFNNGQEFALTNADLFAMVNAGLATYESGVYTIPYTVTCLDSLPQGVSIDDGARSVDALALSLKVVDNNDGTLTITQDPSDLTFKYKYAAAPATVEINGSVTVEKADPSLQPGPIHDGEKGIFEFGLYDPEGKQVGTAVYNLADGTVSFGSLEFATAGTFTYQVKQTEIQALANKGWTIEAGPKAVTITVTDDGNGQLTAATEPFQFTNVYSVKSIENFEISSVFPITKAMTGRDISEGDSFKATISDADGIVYTGTFGTDGVFADHPFTYTVPGDYTYTIEEVLPSGEGVVYVEGHPVYLGVTYDTTKYTVHVIVTDNGEGELIAQATLNKGTAIQFLNSYKASGSFDLSAYATKTLNGRAMDEGEFSFVVSNAMDASDSVLLYGTNEAAADGQPGTIDFYDEIGATETAKFELNTATIQAALDARPQQAIQNENGSVNMYLKVSEITTDLPNGVTVGKVGEQEISTFTVTLLIKDDGKGNLVITSDCDTNPVAFVNNYAPTPTPDPITGEGESHVTVTKVLDGRAIADTDVFTFGLYEGSQQVATGTADKDGKVSFDAVTYTAGGTAENPVKHNYTVKEIQTGTANGITYDTQVANIVTKVVDNLDGTLTITHEAQNVENNTIVFTNKYEAEGDIVLADPAGGFDTKITKTLNGRDMQAGEFKFNVYYANDKAEQKTVVATGQTSNTAVVTDGTATGIKFSTISYKLSELEELAAAPEALVTKVSAGKFEITYNIVENTTGIGGGITPAAFQALTVTVEDQGDGTLKATANYPEEGALSFVNTYAPQSIQLEVKGSLALTTNPEGLTAPKSNEFTFALYEGQLTAAQLATATPLETANNNDSAIDFANKLTFTKAGEYWYTVVQTSPNTIKGYTKDGSLDKEIKYFKVTVSDNGQGVLTPTTNPAEYPLFQFTNVYILDSLNFKLSDAVNVSKTLTGRTIKAGEFTATITEDAATVATGSFKADGSFEDTAIEFTAPAERTFVITEDIPEGTEPIKGVTYDHTAYTVTVKAEDQGDCTMKVTVSVAGVETVEGQKPAITFANAYAVAPEDVSPTGEGQLTISKTLAGRDINDGEFTFTMKDTGGNIVSTGSANASGVVTMSAITFTAANTYNYTITEDIPNAQNGVTYDQASYDVAAVVTDNGEGNLVVEFQAAGEIAFSNTYSPAPKDVSPTGQGQLSITKTLEGRSIVADEFTFSLKQGDTVVSTGKANASGVVNFDAITFTKVGTYEYTLEENIPAATNGVTYDKSKFTVKADVDDDLQGGLIVTFTVSNGAKAAVFNNTYKPEAKEVSPTGDGQLTITKNLDGRDIVDGEFTFSLMQGDKVVSTGKADASGKVTFDAIKYTEVNTYTYTLVEDEGEAKGVTYDKTAHEVIASVADDGAGHLNVEFTVDKGAKTVAFNNIYKAGSTNVSPTGEGQLSITKVLEGRDIKSGEFSFSLKSGETVVSTGVADAKGVVSFGKIEFTEANTYTYTLVENIPAVTEGVTYDTATYTVTAVVTDDGKGSLNVDFKVGTGKTVTFSNAYEAQPITVSPTGEGQLSIAKTLSGRDIVAGEFNFSLKSGEAVVSTGAVDAAGVVSLTPIQYTEAGTYEYTLTENAGTAKGVTYDETSYDVTATVTDDGKGNLSVDFKAGEGKAITFANTYKADSIKVSPTGEGQLSIAKTLEGRAIADGEFSFSLKSGTTVVSTGKANAAGVVSFDAIEYTKAGTYTYTLTEDKGAAKGVTYDSASYTVTAVVTDDGLGNLSVDFKVGEGKSVTFANTYKAGSTTVSPTGKGQLSITKTLEGRDMVDGEFSFSLKSGETVVSTGVADAKGAVTFGEIEFTQAGTYTYTLAEVIPAATQGATGNSDGRTIPTYLLADASAAIQGVTYDTATYTVTAVVTDDLQGGLNVDFKVGNGKTVAFKNTYAADSKKVSPSDPGQLTIVKELDGRDIIDGEFTFSLKENGTVVSTGKANAAGAVTFDAIEFTKAGTYTYEMVENIPATTGGVTYDKTSYAVTAKVVDDLQGNLTVNFTIGQDKAKSATFKNSYEAVVNFTPYGLFTMTGRDAQEGEFTFAIKLTGASGTDEIETTNPFTKEGATSVLDFGQITYTKAELDKMVEDGLVTKTPEGDYVVTFTAYAKSELPGGVSPIAPVNFTVTIHDNGDGTMSSEASYGVDGIQFNVIYAPEAIYVPMVGVNVLTAAPGTTPPSIAGKFTYKLYEGEKAVAGQEIDMTVNDAEGNITFETVCFTKAGTYTYTVVESGLVPGVQNDPQAEKTFTLIVVDDGKGNLSVKNMPAEGWLFSYASSYAVAELNVSINDYVMISKELYGRDIVAGEFTFVIMEGEDVIGTAAVDAEGNIIFPALVYTEPGTHLYTISEVIPEGAEMTVDGYYYKDNIIYGGFVYSVVATVVDNQDGTMSAKFELMLSEEQKELGLEGGASFVNMYTEEEPEIDPEIPSTGDNMWLIGLVAAVAVCGGIVLLVRRPRTDEPTDPSPYSPRTGRHTTTRGGANAVKRTSAQKPAAPANRYGEHTGTRTASSKGVHKRTR